MRYLQSLSFLLFLTFIFSRSAVAQNNIIIIKGIPESVSVDPSTLLHTALRATGHDGKEHVYTGVLLSDVLAKAGIILGNKRESISSYLVMRAKDNYKTIFSLAEVDPLFAKEPILIADKIDGKSLDSGVAPFQVIVSADKIQTRWIRQLVSIELVKPK